MKKAVEVPVNTGRKRKKTQRKESIAHLRNVIEKAEPAYKEGNLYRCGEKLFRPDEVEIENRHLPSGEGMQVLIIPKGDDKIFTLVVYHDDEPVEAIQSNLKPLSKH